MADDPEISRKRDEFKEFLDNHPYSRLGRIEQPQTALVVFSPWGDDSIILVIPEQSRELSTALNSLLLPEPFSALYHRRTRRLEFIYTSFPLREGLQARRFEFTHRKISHVCAFSECSPELLTIAEASRPAQRYTGTDRRNLPLIQSYIHKMQGSPALDDVNLIRPNSFWVDNVDWSEAAAVDLAQHLNFYMTYYDTKSPRIMLHPSKQESIQVQPQTQYRLGRFPSKMRAREIDAELFHFWHATREGDAARRFVYNYQILEYAAHYMLADGIKGKLRRHLLQPHALDSVEEFIEDALDIVSERSMQEHLRIEALLRRAVNPKIIWHEIARNIAYFSKPTIFEGGFEVASIADAKWEVGDFEKNWPSSFAGAIRNIRNGLSHAKEQRMVNVIAPTKNNHVLLQNWVTLVSLAAAESMIYRSEA